MKKTTLMLAKIHSIFDRIKSLSANTFLPRKVTFASILCLFLTCEGSLHAQNTSAILDVEANNKGVLVPRVSLSSTADVLTIVSPATSLLVYNTARTGTYPNNVIPGFYFWDGTRWTPLSGPLAFSEFYALMPGDNTATIAPGTAINFPQNGPTNGIITRSSANQFILPDVGIYQINWQVSVSEAAQLILQLNGTELTNTTVGRATGTSQIVGNTIIITTLPNSILSVVNATGNTPAITITPTAGGTRAVSATLVITRIQ